MIMDKAYKHQICSMLFSNLVIFPSVTMVLVLVTSYFFFSTSKSFPFLLTIQIALLSTMLLVKLIRKIKDKDENLIQNGLQPLLDVTHSEVNQESGTAENHEDGESEAHSDYLFPSDCESSNFSIMDGTFELNIEDHRLQDDLLSDYSLPSDSESSDGSMLEESFEMHQKGNQNEDISDSLASDDDYEGEDEEDSLIEINLPSSHFPDLNEDPKQKVQSKLPEFMPDSIFKQQGLMELLAEFNDMNEDENLIEIDISMGMQISD
ncbi:hypothetical protein VIGAN_05201500 [Vigna angularis var. angularis]|uniref:Transmembrane protein n=2 Tax=Phaseolus angularis TaxID=3914 RepID=A0A0S3S6P9_PHAAN|nr:uncharacterized protein LOC108342668 [Vigna angularis]XP_052734747.1 uncharacterized protein LOC108342668 [Vigna angularis]BAT88506.1 hypothetical protein VIGAN_05201500 [Vigna angularis var. angularis]